MSKLIKIRFPELCGNVLNLLAPIEVAAKIARREAVEKTGLDSGEIGIFFITPCPAKVTALRTVPPADRGRTNPPIFQPGRPKG